MKILQAFKMAIRSITAKKVRAVLTMLGIIIGVASVVIMVSVVQGSNKKMLEYFERMGNNKVSVYLYGRDQKVVKPMLYDYCARRGDLIAGITPEMDLNMHIIYGARNTEKMETGGPRISLGNENYSICNNFQIGKGRDLSYLDSKLCRNVVVLGAKTASYLFDQVEPVGKKVRINGQPFLVIGVYKAKDPDSEYSMDNMAVVPETATRILRSTDQITNFVVKAKNRAAVKQVVTLLGGYLESQMGKDNCSVQSDDQFVDDAKQQNVTMSLVLGGIAGISLLVGGIGIMNIMLVTVSERTREIGIRKAIGAPRASILLQFLVESAMVCGLGGVLGILMGLIGTLIAGKLILKLVLFPDPVLATGAFLFSVVLGIAFGMYPAVIASGLTPVAALRTD